MNQLASFFIFSLQFEELADRDDLMGVEDNAKRDILTLIYNLRFTFFISYKETILRSLCVTRRGKEGLMQVMMKPLGEAHKLQLFNYLIQVMV